MAVKRLEEALDDVEPRGIKFCVMVIQRIHMTM